MTTRSDLATAEWWTAREAATMLKVAPQRISEMTAQGAPHVVVAVPTRKGARRRVLFRRQALFDWLAEHEDQQFESSEVDR